MNPELSNALADLAVRLGTSADKLFPLLVAKAKLDAAITLWGCGIGAALGTAVIVLLIYMFIKQEMDEFTFLPITIVTVITIMFLCFSIQSVGAYQYPEAAALQALVSRSN